MIRRSYHAQRARDELQRSREASGSGAADAHRELGLLHLRRLMASGDAGERREAEQILTILESEGSAAKLLGAAKISRAKPPRNKLSLRFG